jgi:hypothetical protein
VVIGSGNPFSPYSSPVSTRKLPHQRLTGRVTAVADLRDRVRQSGIQVDPFQVRVDELQHPGQIASDIGLVGTSDQVGVLVRHTVLLLHHPVSDGDDGAEAP